MIAAKMAHVGTAPIGVPTIGVGAGTAGIVLLNIVP
jgi:hypothetical protein